MQSTHGNTASLMVFLDYIGVIIVSNFEYMLQKIKREWLCHEQLSYKDTLILQDLDKGHQSDWTPSGQLSIIEVEN